MGNGSSANKQPAVATHRLSRAKWNQIQFGALDGKPVKLVMLFLVPQGQFQKYPHTLANLAKLLHKKDFRDGNLGI